MPGTETYIWGNTQWKTADGTAKTLFQNSSGTRDRTADAVITNGQLAVTETAISDKEFDFLGNTLTISGEESESILTRLSTFASKKAEFPKKRGVGLHYTSVFCAATSVDILGGGWSGSVKPSAPSSIATSFFGST